MKKNENWSSQLGQDKFIIEKIFKNKEEGFYVDVGAHDGVFISNTNSLEKVYKWKGVCIEPSESSSELILNRDSTVKIVSSYCVSPKELSGQIVRFREQWPNEYSTTIFEDLCESPNYAKDLETVKGEFQDRLKKCRTLDEILEENSCPKDIDYISIDTQGCEWLVIKDFPFEKWNVKVFTIANDLDEGGGEKEENRNKTKNLMERSGYELKRVFTLHELEREKWGVEYEDGIIEDLYLKRDD